jgi:D-glycero-alpha-D-manno-heptose-7-phosphate kinase
VSTVFARAPLRVSLGGGGTDLPSWYRAHGGFVVSAAIDKYVYVLATSRFQSGIRLKHLSWEDAGRVEEIEHPILREAIARHGDGSPLELASIADVPPGTGLGSSGAYTVCSLRALHLMRGLDPTPGELAELASELEIDVLERSVGKQDQYVSAHGGVCALTFHPDDSVEVRRLELDEEVRTALRERFLLFFTGGERSASEMFGHQVNATLSGDEAMAANLTRTQELARGVCEALEAGDLDRCGALMNEGWEVKASRAPGVVTERMLELRDLALAAGAAGVSLMGAGGAGFLLVYAPDPDRVRPALAGAQAPELPFAIDDEGCTGQLFP